MRVLEAGQKRVRLISERVDRWLLRLGHRTAGFLVDYRYLISILVIGFVVWALVFNAAVIDYLSGGSWVSRAAWLGPIPDPGTVEIFGFTIEYQPEGYSDYSFYYVHWGYNFLHGVMPYSPEFGFLEIGTITNNNGAHMFPPFTSYFYAAGIALGNIMGWENWGIGFLITAVSYLTALPVYGIASELSKNRRVGEVAALTYLLNPLVLYHSAFLWFNPAPFVFFFFAGFYMLVRGNKLTGTLLIVSAALFKQTAWFLGIPLVVYLLVRPRDRTIPVDETSESDEPSPDSEGEDTQPKQKTYLEAITSYFDLRGFSVYVVIVLVFVGAVMLPFLIAQPHFWVYWRLAMGSFSFEGNYIDPPVYTLPMRIQVLPIMAGYSEFAHFLDIIIVSGGPLGFGVILIAGLMILKDKFNGEETLYFRRILFMTLLMMLFVNLVGPRGVFKYYFIAIVPFFSIFSSARMIRGTDEHVPFSASMAWMPLVLTLFILLPDRNFYLGYVLLIFLGYVFAPLIDRAYDRAKVPVRYFKQAVGKVLEISKKPFTAVEKPVISRRRSVANVIVQLIILGAGIFLIAMSGWLTVMTRGVDIVVRLEIILVFSASLLVGMHFLSIALTMSLNSELRLTHFTGVISSFSYVTVAVLWIFGVWTYFLSWPLEVQAVRQLLVLSATFVSLWTISLLIDQGKHTRLLTDVLLLGGLVVALYTWLPLTNQIIMILGGVGLCAVIVHLLLVSIHYFDTSILENH